MGTIPLNRQNHLRMDEEFTFCLPTACPLQEDGKRSLKPVQDPGLKLGQFHALPGADVQKRKVLAVLVTPHFDPNPWTAEMAPLSHGPRGGQPSGHTVTVCWKSEGSGKVLGWGHWGRQVDRNQPQMYQKRLWRQKIEERAPEKSSAHPAEHSCCQRTVALVEGLTSPSLSVGSASHSFEIQSRLEFTF